MFDNSAGQSLIEEMRTASRTENRAVAAKLDAVRRLFELRRREMQVSGHEYWAADVHSDVAGEVAAALNCTIGMADSYLHYGRVMRKHLPLTAAAFRAGQIDFRTFAAIAYRTGLITDPELRAQTDRRLAAAAIRWGEMSRSRLAAAIDRVVRRVDEDAVRAKRERSERSLLFWGKKGNKLA